jgi:hypothetical protein
VPAEIKVENPLGEYRDRRVYLLKFKMFSSERYDITRNTWISMPARIVWLLTDDILDGEPGEYFIRPRHYLWHQDYNGDYAELGYKTQAGALRKLKKLNNFLDYSSPPDYSQPVPLF